MKNSNKGRETILSEKIEKSLQDWKLPPSSASDIFEPRGSSFCCIPDCRVKTVEREIPLAEGYASFPLFSNFCKRANQICCYNFLRVGVIQVGLKPTKLGSNTSAVICLHDKRILKFYDSILGMVESNLNDGPIYFSYFPAHSVHMSDSCDAFSLDVRIQGNENITLMYRLHYKVMKQNNIFSDVSSRYRVDEKGETTLFITNIAQSNRAVSKKISWDEIGGVDEQGLVVENNLPSSSSCGAVGNANIDWKETAEAHVLKVDVPGFKKEEVKVEVEDGRIVQISGERREEEDQEEENDKWHCVERSSGRFLRRVTLPEDAKLDEVKAAVENGVLTVTVSKEEVNKKPQVKVIHISG